MPVNKAVTEEQLHTELQDVEKRLRDTLEKIILPIREKTEKTYDYLFGNGKPGLDEGFRILKDEVKALVTSIVKVSLST